MKSMFDAMPDNSLKRFYEDLAQYMPTEWLTAIMAIPFPQKAKEILFVVRK